MSEYWAKRQLRIQDRIADKTIEDCEKQIAKYYEQSMRKISREFEATYDKVMATMDEGRQPTPADLYKLDKYWQMQAQLAKEAENLGNKQVKAMHEAFEQEWMLIYDSTSIPSDLEFATISEDGARAMINTAWLADGKTYSERIWKNVESLVDTLNDGLVHCIVTGKKTTELREILQERFNVSRGRANTLIRTEVAHIQTEAAKQRYEDAGLTYYEYLGREEHDIGCNCKKLNGKIFKYSEYNVGTNAPPLHPNCRCAIIPVVDDALIKEMEMKETEDIKIKDNKVEKDKKVVSKERKKELVELAGKVNSDVSNKTSKWTWDKENGSRVERLYDGLKSLFLIQLDNTSRKLINKGEKREIREMVEDWTDSMFKQCVDCGRVFIKDNPKSNRAIRCPECQKEERKRQKAADKKRAKDLEKQKKYEEKRRADKAEWARKNRAKQKAMKL